MEPHRVNCEECGAPASGYSGVNYGSIEQGYRLLCNRCFNAEVAKRSSLENFENIRFEPIAIKDCAGEEHRFHFEIRLLGDKVALEAFELRDGNPAGYRFQLLGDPEGDLFALLGRSVERIRRRLAVKYITDGSCGPQIADTTVQGRIEWDDAEDGRMPLVVVDGRELTWDEFGRMWLAFEGWQFKLEILDPSDEG